MLAAYKDAQAQRERADELEFRLAADAARADDAEAAIAQLEARAAVNAAADAAAAAAAAEELSVTAASSPLSGQVQPLQGLSSACLILCCSRLWAWTGVNVVSLALKARA